MQRLRTWYVCSLSLPPSLSLRGGHNDTKRDPHIDLISQLLSLSPVPSFRLKPPWRQWEAIRSLSNVKGGGRKGRGGMNVRDVKGHDDVVPASVSGGGHLSVAGKGGVGSGGVQVAGGGGEYVRGEGRVGMESGREGDGGGGGGGGGGRRVC
jgi:hypothetical protein